MAIVRMQQRRDTALNWSTYNPVLRQGELGFDTNARKFKIGDGETDWNGLDYLLEDEVAAALAAQGAAEDAQAAAEAAAAEAEATAESVIPTTDAAMTAVAGNPTSAFAIQQSASIDARVPAADTTTQGKVELATTAEAQAGTDTVRAVTPAGAKAAIDTLGGAQFTPADVLQGTGIDLTGATDCSTALKALIAAGLTAGAKRFVGVHGATYKITATESQSFLTLTGTSGITFDLSNSTIDNSATSYGAGTITPIFKLDGCTATEILVGKYLGFTLASPSTEIGYKGPILVYAINGTKRTRIVAPDATNLRYGLMTGDYGDYTKGQCAGFDVKIRGSMIGYPVAAYYADDITLDIDVDGVHRAAYLGGCQGVRGVLRFKDQYIAPYALYFTNCITSGTDAAAQVAPPANPTTSRGCSDANLTITDKGSTVFNAAGALIGMGLERVDPTEHKNIKVNGYVVGTDTLSTKTGLFNLVSANAPLVWSRYADEFTSSIVFRDIEIGGVCDHSAQTTDGNTTTGDIYVRSVDQDNSAAYATLRNISITAKLRKGSGTHQPIYFQAPGLQGQAKLAIDAAGAIDATIYTNGTAVVDLTGAKLANVNAATGLDSGGSRVLLGPGADIASRTDGSAPQRCMIDGGQLAGAGVRRVVIDSYIDLTGASVSGNPTLPAGAKIVGWSGRVVTAITGPTSANWKVGVTGADDCFLQAGNVGNTVGTTFGVQHRNTGTALPDLPASSKLTLVTAIGSNFTAGRIHFVLIVDVVDVPTS